MTDLSPSSGKIDLKQWEVGRLNKYFERYYTSWLIDLTMKFYKMQNYISLYYTVGSAVVVLLPANINNIMLTEGNRFIACIIQRHKRCVCISMTKCVVTDAQIDRKKSIGLIASSGGRLAWYISFTLAFPRPSIIYDKIYDCNVTTSNNI